MLILIAVAGFASAIEIDNGNIVTHINPNGDTISTGVRNQAHIDLAHEASVSLGSGGEEVKDKKEEIVEPRSIIELSSESMDTNTDVADDAEDENDDADEETEQRRSRHKKHKHMHHKNAGHGQGHGMRIADIKAFADQSRQTKSDSTSKDESHSMSVAELEAFANQTSTSKNGEKSMEKTDENSTSKSGEKSTSNIGATSSSQSDATSQEKEKTQALSAAEIQAAVSQVSGATSNSKSDATSQEKETTHALSAAEIQATVSQGSGTKSEATAHFECDIECMARKSTILKVKAMQWKNEGIDNDLIQANEQIQSVAGYTWGQEAYDVNSYGPEGLFKQSPVGDT